MKKGKRTMMICVGLAVFVLSAIICMQFKLVSQTDITSIENLTEAQLREELANIKEKYKEVETQYNENEKKIENYQTEDKSDTEKSEILQNELDQVSMVLGTVDVQGQGIIITIDDRNMEKDSIQYYDLLYIVNSLKAAGAEAISINDHRVINTTDIVNLSSLFIKVNGERILAPYVIKAIGNQTYLEGALLGNGGYVDLLEKNEFKVNIELKSNVEIYKIEKDITSQYIN